MRQQLAASKAGVQEKSGQETEEPGNKEGCARGQGGPTRKNVIVHVCVCIDVRVYVSENRKYPIRLVVIACVCVMYLGE